MSLQHAAERAEKDFNNVRLEGKQDRKREAHLSFFLRDLIIIGIYGRQKMQYASTMTAVNYKF